MLLESKETHHNQVIGVFSTNFLFQVWDFPVSLMIFIRYYPIEIAKNLQSKKFISKENNSKTEKSGRLIGSN